MQPHVRPLRGTDAAHCLTLYRSLTFGPKTVTTTAFQAVVDHPGTTVFGADVDGRILAMVTLHLLPNVTWNARPYGLVENVVTHPDFQRRGLGREVMQAALDHAWAADAYKVMLLTGLKRGASGFYQAVGFSSEDKTGLVIRQP